MTSFLKLRDWIDIEKLDWRWLSANPNAIELLMANPDKINWDRASMNLDTSYPIARSANPNAIELLMANPDKINWGVLSRNPSAMELLTAMPKQEKSNVFRNTSITHDSWRSSSAIMILMN
jgi:hypothetical protein